jgi:hypothetical protein
MGNRKKRGTHYRRRHRGGGIGDIFNYFMASDTSGSTNADNSGGVISDLSNLANKAVATVSNIGSEAFEKGKEVVSQATDSMMAEPSKEVSTAYPPNQPLSTTPVQSTLVQPVQQPTTQPAQTMPSATGGYKRKSRRSKRSKRRKRSSKKRRNSRRYRR